MKLLRTIALFCAVLCTTAAAAQDNPAKWSAGVKHLGGADYRVTLTARIDNGWHIYDLGPYEAGPSPTVVTFKAEGAEIEGGMEVLDKAHRYYDDIFMTEIGTFEKRARFAQNVRLTADKATVTMDVEWMACNDQSCVAAENKTLTVTIEGTPAAVQPAEDTASANDSAVKELPEKKLPATEESAAEPANGTETAEIAEPADSAYPAEESTATATKDAAGGGSLWGLIIEAVLWGFAALLTPCVFPMVPMTVSFFLKGEGGPARGRLRAALYGLFIVLLYTVPIAAIILITRIVGGDAITADIFNWLATHWLPNIVFFVVFMLFAASFFGAFEITMPSWLVNKSDSKADTKGIGGIFFLALTLVLVSFSCTGPIVGSVLIKSTSGEFWTPIITMLAFSLAFALPFTLFAVFPSLLKSLPSNGGWLNSVKVVIGFIEVALGFKFLSVADQTYHWGLLDREVYLAIWIVVFALMGLYLLGKIRFAHDSDVPYIGVGRLALVIAVFSFVVYLIPGMWGAPLKALSGYLPPLHTQDFVTGATSAAAEQSGKAVTTAGNAAPGHGKYSDFLHLPHGLEGFFDLKEAEAYAAEAGKPLFIDFTGHGCVNCREMEMRVWSSPEVLDMLRNDYVIVALYADDKKELPESEWVTTENGKVLKSLGKINSHYALTTYGVNAQPYYVLQSPDGRILTQPMGRNLDVAEFAGFLRRGLESYKAEK